MALTERDWKNIVETRCGGDALAVSVRFYGKRVHIGVDAAPGKSLVVSNALRALASDYASDLRITWMVL